MHKLLPAELHVGLRLPPLQKGPLMSSHIVRWSAAMQNWEKIHYDQQYAREVADLPGTLVNGSFKQHFLAQFLSVAFDARGWVFRIDYRFTGMDLVGQTLEVRGRIADIGHTNAFRVIAVDFEIWNLEQETATTRGHGTVILATDGSPIRSIDAVSIPRCFRMAREVTPSSDDLPSSVRDKVGTVLERMRSDYEVDASRLRLFCDAIMNIRSLHFDFNAAREQGYDTIAAPPLFPMHGIELKPGKAELSSDPMASGREGSPSIIGRDLARQVGMEDRGLLNGGSEVEIESFVQVGERIEVESRLLSAQVKRRKTGAALLVLQRLNTYREIGGRVLLVHKPTTLFRMDVM